MIYESVRRDLRARKGKPATLRRPGSHTWVHGLPLKLRFKRSKIYVSAIPVWAIGFIIGFVGAIMGIGGGFLLVPMLIYFLRVPTATVIGTSMVLTLVTMASATVMHAATNHLVDAVLALILMVGGVIGAQFGARTGQNMRGERLRLLLGLLVFAVGLRFAFELVVQPDDLFSIRHVRSRMMRRLRVLSARDPDAPACNRPAAAERLVVSLSNHRVQVDLEFHRRGPGAVRHRRARPPATALRADYDLVVTVTGPRETMRTRRKERVLGIWVNVDSREFVRVPSYLAVLSNRPVDADRQRRHAAAPAARPRQFPAAAAHRSRHRRHRARRSVPRRLRAAADTARPLPRSRQRGDLPHADGVPRGNSAAGRMCRPATIDVDVKLFADGALIARTNSALEVIKAGFEQFVADAARDHGLLYGLAHRADGAAHRLVRQRGVPRGTTSIRQTALRRERIEPAPRPAYAR